MKTLLFLSFSFLLVNCGNYDRSPEIFNPKEAGSFSTDLDFATLKREILEPHCISCHTGKHAAYANYDTVKLAARGMLARMESQDPGRQMPPSGFSRVPLAQINRFREWVNAGTPEFKNGSPDAVAVEPIGFSEVRTQVLKSNNCTACHSQYNDYQTVFNDRNKIAASMASGFMPFAKRKGLPTAPVPEEQQKLFFNWVSQGAPLEAEGAPGVAQQPELQPTFISLRNQVFGPKCILCHNSFASRGGGRLQSMESYQNLRNWFTKTTSLFKFKKKEGDAPGLFVEAILRDPEDPLAVVFSPMPFNSPDDDVEKDIPPITEDELKVIQQWIELELPFDETDLPKETK